MISLNYCIVNTIIGEVEERILTKELMKKIVPFAIDDCLEHSLNILFRHTSYTDQRIDDWFLANEEEPVCSCSLIKSKLTSKHFSLINIQKLIELDFCAPNAAKSIVKKETYDKVNIDSTDDLGNEP